MFKKYLLLILLILLVFVSSDIFAQPGVVPPPDTPIDAGLGILLAFGVGYAVKKIRDKR